jgi:ABC-type transport system involved in Fe-S cluster assembly fused permease/ATPase subunit
MWTTSSVTHRLASVAGADQVIVLDQGHIAAAPPT